MTATVEQTIEVQVPIETAYNQWTQFEEFPQFIEGVDPRDATILSVQNPEERVAWHNIDGKDNAGVVTFHKIDDAVTRIAVQMDFAPEGLKEKLGDAIGVPNRRVKADLERFKQFIEARGQETGAWRGEVPREG
jgi:uncharacterized membrane protein